VFLAFFALPHTEGCGVSDGSAETIYRRTILGHLVSPLVKYGVLLEHGCEKTHNAYMSQHMVKEFDLNNELFGWASVQLDGGIEAVTEKVMQMFISKLLPEPQPIRVMVGLQHLRIAFVTLLNVQLSDTISKVLAYISQQITGCGGLVIIPQNSGLANAHSFMSEMLGQPAGQPITPSLAYGQKPVNYGFHMMETLSDNWAEILTGLGATGIEIMVYIAEGRQISRLTPSHPMIPLVRVVNPVGLIQTKAVKGTLEDFDLVLSADPATWQESLLQLILDIASNTKFPKNRDLSDFQISRGPLGISM